MYSNELKMTESREARIIFRITTTTCNNLRNIKLKQKSREFDQKLIFFCFGSEMECYPQMLATYIVARPEYFWETS